MMYGSRDTSTLRKSVHMLNTYFDVYDRMVFMNTKNFVVHVV